MSSTTCRRRSRSASRTKSNRDAIGASVTNQAGAGRQSARFRPGLGFSPSTAKISSSAWGIQRVRSWRRSLAQRPCPGTPQSSWQLQPRIWVEEGGLPSRNEPFPSHAKACSTARTPPESKHRERSPPDDGQTWLLHRPFRSGVFPLIISDGRRPFPLGAASPYC